ncbi:hypothetical protein C8F04DRAFT_1262138 [Mycena alexandri]|uniref:Uncharacterized protein n=1 Tax=Mycena alexandri TaxID=1745969 RepID=A0AAD6SR24_9AGAR|nr:hypothetical protein C8F04DRAFT_1262138 [Mycena alexandri]
MFSIFRLLTVPWLMFISALVTAGSATALPHNWESESPSPAAGRFFLFDGRAIESEDITDIAQNVVAPIAGGTFVAICLLILFCCFRVKKGPKKEEMGPGSIPEAERPPWARA